MSSVLEDIDNCSFISWDGEFTGKSVNREFNDLNFVACHHSYKLLLSVVFKKLTVETYYVNFKSVSLFRNLPTWVQITRTQP